jgi:hypothetical protein
MSSRDARPSAARPSLSRDCQTSHQERIIRTPFVTAAGVAMWPRLEYNETVEFSQDNATTTSNDREEPPPCR